MRRWLANILRRIPDACLIAVEMACARMLIGFWYGLGFVAAALFLVSLLCAPAKSETIPTAAAKHRAELTRCGRYVWGLSAPVATLAGQVHQESGWREGAVSPVGAR
ncbi:MAG: lytic transglycosylase domain-containing protein, partial [Desulfovibrionaceae bacterium]